MAYKPVLATMLRPADGRSYRVRITPVTDEEVLKVVGAQIDETYPTWGEAWKFVYETTVVTPLEESGECYATLHNFPHQFVVEVFAPDWFDDARAVWQGDSQPMHPTIAAIHYESPERMWDYLRMHRRQYKPIHLNGDRDTERA